MFKCLIVQMFNCPNVQMFKCLNVQMFKCSNVQMFKYFNIPMFKCSDDQMFYVQMFRCSSVQCSNIQMVFWCSDVQMFKCSNVQMFKCSNIQIIKCWNVKSKMSNVNKDKLLSERSFLILGCQGSFFHLLYFSRWRMCQGRLSEDFAIAAFECICERAFSVTRVMENGSGYKI